jgi:hypothetical protein
MIVPRVRTPLPLASLPAQLQDAGRLALGADPGLWRCRCAWAQLVLEHGRESAGGVVMLGGIFGWNFGNHDVTDAERADPSVPVFSTVPEHEGDAASSATQVHVRRAYASPLDGLAAFWQLFITGRFAGAWEAMGDPDGPERFAVALASLRYYTADEAAYAGALRRLWDEAAACGA